ncbi:DNA-binding transcriptional ArsR family regulator [Streptomyces umbrinus]|uniref:DNA-binding transcriptional ArsR family regulator n=1 Tax=Streptomyces umbrinus TaxID=67370 RepID=A0ABU0SWH5_9ACTN|nr:winged helix-turn-helix domain-containing protein [Streptomyces umbrinus]MDQ1027895.1 DNA-binding transcriptional ArsR family regulator [Streptomyces umbrinus]
MCDRGLTSEVARRAGVTSATVSEHVRILREAGLTASVRDRNTMLHVPTPLGLSLLTANRSGEVRRRGTESEEAVVC